MASRGAWSPSCPGTLWKEGHKKFRINPAMTLEGEAQGQPGKCGHWNCCRTGRQTREQVWTPPFPPSQEFSPGPSQTLQDLSPSQHHFSYNYISLPAFLPSSTSPSLPRLLMDIGLGRTHKYPCWEGLTNIPAWGISKFPNLPP